MFIFFSLNVSKIMKTKTKGQRHKNFENKIRLSNKQQN